MIRAFCLPPYVNSGHIKQHKHTSSWHCYLTKLISKPSPSQQQEAFQIWVRAASLFLSEVSAPLEIVCTNTACTGLFQSQNSWCEKRWSMSLAAWRSSTEQRAGVQLGCLVLKLVSKLWICESEPDLVISWASVATAGNMRLTCNLHG